MSTILLLQRGQVISSFIRINYSDQVKNFAYVGKKNPKELLATQNPRVILGKL
jgi:hypothetical protein